MGNPQIKDLQTSDWESSLKTITWREINRRYFQELPNLLPLVDMVLTLPSTSADCERGFSAMKRIKTEHRASLLPSSLDDLMMVNINAPPIAEFDPQRAIDDWIHKKERRIQKDNCAQDATDKSESSDESDCDNESVCSIPPLSD